MNAELLRELARIARSSELHDLRVGLTPDETDALANMLEREHEEVERLRAGIRDLMVSLTFETPPTELQWGRIRIAASTWLANDAARKR